MLDLKTFLPGTSAVEGVLLQVLVADIDAVRVGHDVRDARFCGRGDDFGVQVWRGGDGEGDDEELLAVQGGGEGVF